ncbi:UNVERIFIED_CONTAM: hypothetical protein Sindi_1771300 [Sesamum indicum]
MSSSKSNYDLNSASATFPHRAASPAPREGPSRVRSHRGNHVEKSNSEDSPTYVKFQAMELIPHQLSVHLDGEKLIPDWKILPNNIVLGYQFRSRSLLEMFGIFVEIKSFPNTETTNYEARFLRLQHGSSISRIKLEEKLASKVAKAMDSRKEIRFFAGHAAGKIASAIEQARIQGAHDFMRAPAFETALEIKAANHLMQGFDIGKHQVSTLNGFAPDFDMSRLDPGLDGKFQPFADEAVPLGSEDEFTILLDEIEDN